MIQSFPSEEFFQRVLAQVRSLSPISLQRIGDDVLDRKRPPDELDDAEQYLFYVLCNFLPHPDKLAYYKAMRQSGGGVGIDEHSRLVRTLPSGCVEVLKDAALDGPDNGD